MEYRKRKNPEKYIQTKHIQFCYWLHLGLYYYSRLHTIFAVVLCHESYLFWGLVYCNRAIIHLQVAFSVTILYLSVSHTLYQVHLDVYRRWVNKVCVYTLNHTFIRLFTAQYQVDIYWKSSHRAHRVFTGQCNWMTIYCLLDEHTLTSHSLFHTYHNTPGISNIHYQTPWNSKHQKIPTTLCSPTHNSKHETFMVRHQRTSTLINRNANLHHQTRMNTSEHKHHTLCFSPKHYHLPPTSTNTQLIKQTPTAKCTIKHHSLSDTNIHGQTQKHQ